MNSRDRMARTLATRNRTSCPWISAAASRQASTSASSTSCGRRWGWTPGHAGEGVEVYQMLGEIKDDLRDLLGIDTVPLYGSGTMFGFPRWSSRSGGTTMAPRCWCRWTSTRSTNPTAICSSTGGRPLGPASGHMPAGGDFFDAIIRQEPIDEDRLDPADNLEEFGPVEANELELYGSARSSCTPGRPAPLLHLRRPHLRRHRARPCDLPQAAARHPGYRGVVRQHGHAPRLR